MEQRLAEIAENGPQVAEGESQLTPTAQRVLVTAMKRADEQQSRQVLPEHLLLVLLAEPEIGDLLRAAGVDATGAVDLGE